MNTVSDVTGKLCVECKSNPQLKRKGTRKFDICYECRIEFIKEMLAARKVRRVLSNSMGRIVQYYDQGWRYGYLVDFTKHTAIVQPVGPGPLAHHIRMPIIQVQPSSGQSIKYPTLESYVASKPKSEPVRPIFPEGYALDGPSVVKAMEQGAVAFDAAKAVELYKAGMKIIDIAVQMGYPRGQGNNRTRKALREAGVLQ